jgi:hypothetical protein
MRTHFIAIGGSAMHNLALALHNKGYQVTGSDDAIFEPSKSRLEKKGILPTKENVRFIGRFDFTEMPKVWAPGAYIEFWFKGTTCSLEIEDDPSFNSHNYIEIQVDEQLVRRIKLEETENLISVLKSAKNKLHHVYIVKCTEAGIGSISFGKIYCEKLIKPTKAFLSIEIKSFDSNHNSFNWIKLLNKPFSIRFNLLLFK